jgi:hypothetical protein
LQQHEKNFSCDDPRAPWDAAFLWFYSCGAPCSGGSEPVGPACRAGIDGTRAAPSIAATFWPGRGNIYCSIVPVDVADETSGRIPSTDMCGFEAGERGIVCADSFLYLDFHGKMADVHKGPRELASP